MSNPASGSADEEVRAEIEGRLQEVDDVTPFVATSAESFATELQAKARPFDLVVVAGGDGTFSHTVNALSDRLEDVTFGLVPLGTGNDLAGSLGINGDPVDIAAGLRAGTHLELDLGRATAPGFERPFVNACVGGFSVAVNEAIDEDTKRRLGPLAFWLGGLRAARDITRYEVRINDTHIEDVVVLGVGNGRRAGGGFELWPEADPGDGLLDVCAIAAPALPGALKAAAKVKRGTHESDENVVSLRSARVELEARPEMEFNLDGELVGLRTPLTLDVAGKIRMLIPGAGAATRTGPES